MSDPPIWPDEPVLSDTAVTLLTSGKIATNIYGTAVKGMNTHAYWYPPVYFYTLAGYIKLFGQDIVSLRIFSLTQGLLVLIVFALLLSKFFSDRKFVYLGVFMLSIDRSFMKSSHIVRMDILAFLFMLLAFLSFWIVRRKTRIFLIIPGIFAALSSLTHPTGLITIAILAVYYIFEKISIKEKIKGMLYLILPTFIGISAWLLSMVGNFDIFVYQFGLQFIRKGHLTSSIIYFFNADIFWRILFIFYFLIFLLLVFLFWKSKEKLFLFNIIGLLVVAAILFGGKEMWYLLYFPPFIIMGILLALVKFKSSKNLKYIFYLIPIVFIALHIIIMVRENQFSLKFDYDEFGRDISSDIPQGSTVFLASVPDPYFSLKAQNNYKLYEFPTEFINNTDYLSILNQSDYIVFNLVPSKLAAIYILRNRESDNIIISNENEFHVVKLLPREKRII